MPRSAKTASSTASESTEKASKPKSSKSTKAVAAEVPSAATKVAAKPAKAAKAAAAETPAAEAASGSRRSSSKSKSKTAAKRSAAAAFTEARLGAAVPAEPRPAAKKPKAPASSDISGYQAALRWLHDRADIERMRVVRYSDDAFKLDRMRTLLGKLGNPHEQFRSIHVGGTNGKGATVAMLASMLEGCGYTVGRYTSPHLIDVRERISIDGSPIDRASFTDAIRAVAEASASLDSPPTFFEVVTAAAFKHFAEQAIDIAVIEVGLGGRLDSTNVITPEVSIVTSIELDHTRLLGATRQEIAREKAGIFKPGVPALAFDLDNPIDAVMREIAAEIGAPFKVVNKDIEFSSRFCSSPDLGPHTRVCLYSQTSRLEHLPVPLPGEHQAGNCGLALAAIDIL
ncbi:MAG: bifunctional folylpolyglutamate synthase/dihydrofolate synthase, partial [Phycisphaerales bacterium]